MVRKLFTIIILFVQLLFIQLARTDDARIVGGKNANRSYPYQISLQIKMEKYIAWLPQDEWAHNCGGSIVTPTCVVTAAHCVVNYTAQQLTILSGTSKLKGGGGVRYLVKNLTVHPNYRELESSDIAVMKIDGPIKFDEKTAPIEYSDQEIGGGINCTLTGWGYTTPIRFGAPPNDLQVAVLPSITNQECKERGLKPSETEMCTYSHFGQGACGGDSGGPLTIEDGKALVGVVSYGSRFCATGLPDAFTRVSMFTGWIRENCGE